MNRRHFGCVPSITLIVAALGCSNPERCFVEGTVTLHGKPITDGEVVLFCPTLGCGGSAPLNAEGVFRIEGPLKAGSYLVTVQPPPAPPPHSPDGKTGGSGSRQASYVPQKYRKQETTDLRIEVGPGNNRVELDLK